MGPSLAYYDMLYEMEYRCQDGQLTGQQLRDVVVNLLRRYPEHRDTRASTLSFLAITDAFNCNRQTGSQQARTKAATVENIGLRAKK
ncbi:Rap1a/Tai family immunity protein [Bradyrhizobium jicamae]|uniref:Rap1a/Tai family immunity protein n=1 Tax=Bradyrhizobium jicamae TaxID=280332 RepID=UPI001BA52943|nr:Rap1a/Tai family immunity protein [Bradyrhizobium jicamae]MBR0939419.1 hypothetical protein [Bradyrhizobium jicamae]